MDPTTASRPRSTNQQSAERDGLIEELSGVFWAALLVKPLGLFRSYRTAARALRRMHKKRQIVRVGEYDITPNQNPTQLFTSSRHTIKADTIRSHEVPLSRLVAPFYRLADEIRGPYGVDPKTLPDREMEVGDVCYRWEYYTGKQDSKQLLKRLQKYAGGSDDPILAVCRKARYMDKVRAASVEAGIADILYLATYDEVIATPFSKVWRASDGERVAVTLPRRDAVHNP